jgi:hypothetical protein
MRLPDRGGERIDLGDASADAATESSTSTLPDGRTMLNPVTRPSFSIRILTNADIFVPAATTLVGCTHSL